MVHIKTDFLFVYSSLRRGFPTQDYEYISKYFDFAGDAKTRGVLSIMNNIVVGTPVEEEKYIHGELFKIKEPSLFSFAIGQLDEYEGVHPEPPEQPKYVRSTTRVFTDGGEELVAWVYWYNGSVYGLPVLESGNVLDYLNGNK
ncbi:MAG: gamma-glutamylcyclotransferase [Chitinophagaceae bacterium]|nr:gamma-glutamylcyclotransferase [Chitinophagaceae bacterium]